MDVEASTNKMEILNKIKLTQGTIICPENCATIPITLDVVNIITLNCQLHSLFEEFGKIADKIR